MERGLAFGVAVMVVAVALAGCLGGTPDGSTSGPGGAGPVNAGPVDVITFEGEASAGWRTPAGPTPASRHTYPVPVDASIGHLSINLSYEGGPQAMDAILYDHDGRMQCQAIQDEVPKRCTAPVPRSLAGPVEWTVDVGPAIIPPVPGTAYRLVVERVAPGAFVPEDPAAGTDATIRFRTSDTGAVGFEPTLGLLADGTLFVQQLLATMRSTDDGHTWQDVAPLTTSQETLDPMLRVDPWTGRVYVDQLTGACSVLAWSDDAGSSWTTNPAACGTPVNDHQKLAAGPSPLPATPGPAVYYAYWDFADGVFVSRSYDGGFTFTTTRLVPPPGGPDPYYTGPIEADRDGNVYVSFYLCGEDGGVGAGVSHDHGLTFEAVRAATVPGPCKEPDPGIGVDAAGNVYLAFNRPSGTYLVVSTDHGETWGEPVRVSPDGLGSFMHVDLAAGDDGRVAVAFRATPDATGPADEVDGWARWYLYVSFVENATGPEPQVRTALATAADDLVQLGPICTGFYPPCIDDSRNLGEFIDVAVGPDGRTYVAYDDGCADPCETPADSRDGLGMVAILEDGPRLYRGAAPWAEPASAVGPGASFTASSG